MLTKEHDIVIIGGGIQGAGCAQAAAAAGYSVCLLEKNSWGSATSSHSSKLIHGGLRYLETYQFGLVRKSLHERKILMEIAAPLLKPLPFYIPVYQQSRHQPWMIFTGLSLYSLLGGFDRLSRFHRIPKNKWKDLEEPEIRPLTPTNNFYFRIVITAKFQSPPLQKPLQDFASQFSDWISTFAISG